MIGMGGIFNDGHPAIPRRQLTQDCLMLGWNASQVTEFLTEMSKNGEITLRNGNVVMCND
jgi:hypothetical protein